MKKETFNKLSLEKQVELYNEWLTEEEVKERFESKDFLDWLEGQRLGDYNVI